MALVEILGAVLLVAGVAVIFWPAALIVAGILAARRKIASQLDRKSVV